MADQYVKMIIVSVCLIIVFLWFHFRTKNATLSSWPILDIFVALGDGIFNVDKDLWKMQRRMIQSSPLRKQSVFRSIRSGIKEKVADGIIIPGLNLVPEERQEIDLQELFQQFSFDTVRLMVLGIDPGSLSGKSLTSKYQKAFDRMEETAMSRILSPTPFWKLRRWLQIGIEKHCLEAVKTMDSYLHERISLQREQLEQARSALGEEAGLTDEEIDTSTV